MLLINFDSLAIQHYTRLLRDIKIKSLMKGNKNGSLCHSKYLILIYTMLSIIRSDTECRYADKDNKADQYTRAF